MTNYAVFANGAFWGTWDADTPEAACQMAADKVGTDGDTTGLEAKPAAECDPSDMDH